MWKADFASHFNSFFFDKKSSFLKMYYQYKNGEWSTGNDVTQF